MDGKFCVLGDRGVIEVAGADAAGFLQRLITNSVRDIPQGEGRYAGFLTPQGKLLFDFFAVPLPEGGDAGYLIDCARAQAADLVKRLNMHKLRANITIGDKSETLAVAAVLSGEAPAGIEGLVFRDSRTPLMGLRIIAPRDILARLTDTGEAVYEAHRIAQGVPKGGIDFVYGDAFPHDINLDLMNGVDFKKGCYVGQEVVSRVHFRKSARKRIAKIQFDGETLQPGTPIMAGEANIGQLSSAADGVGLAMLRIDRLEEAVAAGIPMKAGDVPVSVTLPV
jgi:folate-binding protein YgfZ